jgi:hypothetical protein
MEQCLVFACLAEDDTGKKCGGKIRVEVTYENIGSTITFTCPKCRSTGGLEIGLSEDGEVSPPKDFIKHFFSERFRGPVH